MAPSARPEVVTTSVQGVTFSFYTDDEVRKLSVKRISSPIIFDSQNNPVPSGLYDPALGPLESLGTCTTCNLGYMQCPGHFGHIELPVPVYNPLVFPFLYKLLRATCLHCFHFRTAGPEVDHYRRRARALMLGEVSTAMELPRSSARSAMGKKLFGEDLGLADGVVEREDVSDEEAPEMAAALGRARLCTHAQGSMRALAGELLASAPAGKCANCGAHSPQLRKDGYAKLFLMPLAANREAANKVRGTVVHSVLEILRSSAAEATQAIEDQAAEELSKPKASRKKPTKGKSKNANDGGGVKGEGSGDDMSGEEGSESDGNGSSEGTRENEGSGSEGETEGSDHKGGIEGFDAAKSGISSKKTGSREMGGSGEDGAGGADGGKGGVEKRRPKYVTPSEAEEMLKLLWSKEWRTLRYLFGAFTNGRATAAEAPHGYRLFFLRTLPVAPNKFRPVSRIGDQVFEHAQNTSLQRAITTSLDLLAMGSEGLGRSVQRWLELQGAVNALIDSKTAGKGDKAAPPGIRQRLEKKEGMFRMHMMGKRVNFAARSVISPDVYLSPGEIGVPPYFAKKLSFPERVTPHNVERLRALVVRGAEEHPGAVAVEDDRGRVVLLERMSKDKREALAKGLLRGATEAGAVGGARADRGRTQVVYRHLMDGDLMLTNRQPTLHKPGLMAHRARVLRGERTIRMHYANCSTFNADFDGDEINLHLPQDHLARAEGYHIVHADHQYIVPTDGKPIRGLIQDHVFGATLLTRRDAFLTRAQFTHLVYLACAPTRAVAADAFKSPLPPPAVLKPRPMWTGKQVVGAVLGWLTRGMPPMTMQCGGKVPAAYWGKGNHEATLIVRGNDVLAGVIDKAQFGKNGLVHAVHELYGDEAAGKLLACFSRLFTGYLQTFGFTCGIDDALLVGEAEGRRAQLLQGAEPAAVSASCQFAGDAAVTASSLSAAGSNPGTSPSNKSAPLFDEGAVRRAEAQARSRLSHMFRANFQGTGAALDAKVSGAMHPLSSEVIKACLPDGQRKPFRTNMLSLMTVTGAKGSLVNFSQISCLLGQQELEGRRTPRMASGKTLPCFRPFDAGARAGGFIGDRFLTGLRPQEYYFHCMAGRDGLVDTAVKTARSGYLQRCLIKNLEALTVAYDATVRDASDGSIVQFVYGEDGSDVMRASYARRFDFLADNAARVAQQLGAGRVGGEGGVVEGQVSHARRRRQKALARNGPESVDRALPVQCQYPPTALGCVPESYGDAVAEFLTKEGGRFKQASEGKGARGGGVDGGVMTPSSFSHLMDLKYLTGMADPGEAVGVIAGQSLGEPSTQMTLNTFHMAGRGEANVTLGIPRLREILMTAAMTCKTPVMTLPVRHNMGITEATALATQLRKLRLAEVLAGMRVEEFPAADARNDAGGLRSRLYRVCLDFYPSDAYPAEASLAWHEIESAFESRFLPRLKSAIKAEIKRKTGGKEAMGRFDVKGGGDGDGGDGEGDGGDGEGEMGGEGKDKDKGMDMKMGKKKDKDDDDEDEGGEEEGDGRRRWHGDGREMKTYEEMDDEDKAIARRAERAQRRMGEGNATTAKRDGSDSDGESGSGASGDEGGGNDAIEKRRMGIVKGEGSGRGGDRRGRGGGGDGGAVTGRADGKAWRCEVSITLPLDSPKLLILELAQQAAVATPVRITPGIDKVFVLGEGAGGEGPARVQTDGINVEAALGADDVVDVNKIRTNDVGTMLRYYGVEAARATIVHEVKSVFAAYGIAVDPRHLSLIADYMTFLGSYRPMNRIGIDSSPCPFLKMSFETASQFLTDATLKGAVDDLRTPSSALVLGRVAPVGTGVCDIYHRLG